MSEAARLWKKLYDDQKIDDLEIQRVCKSLSELVDKKSTPGKLLGVLSTAMMIIRKQHEVIRAYAATMSNEALTLEELQEMGGEPVYVISPSFPEGDGWRICEGAIEDEDGDLDVVFNDDVYENADELNVFWFAYRRPPQKES